VAEPHNLFGSPTSRVSKQTKGEEDCSKTLEDTQEGKYGAEHAVSEAGREQGKCYRHHHDSKSNREASYGSLPGVRKLIVILTHELVLECVEIWETFAEEKSHLVAAGFLAVEEKPQRTVFVDRLTIGELLELPNAIFHKRLDLVHVLGQHIKAAYQPSIGEERNEDHERGGNGHDSPED